MTMAIGYPNVLASTATITASSAGAATPASNVQTDVLSSVWRSTDATSANTIIDIDHGAALSCRALAIVGHNLSAAATVQWTRGTTSGGSEVDDSGAIDAWQITPIVRDGAAHHIIIDQGAATSARYDRITIVDESNPAGYVEVAFVSLWELLVPQFDAAYGLQDTLIDTGRVERSTAGALWRNRQRTLRGTKCVLQASPHVQADQLHEMLRCAGQTDLLLYMRNTSDAAATQRYGFVGTFAELSAIDYPYRDYRSLALSVVEYA